MRKNAPPAFGNSNLFFGPPVSANTVINQYSITEKVLFYFEAGSTPDCAAFFDGPLSSGNGFTCEATGHTVAVP
jgi:hypothetical protein